MDNLEMKKGDGESEPGRFSKKESEGFGDTVKKVSDMLGIPQCGACGKRQQKLIRLIPYKKKDKKKK